MADSIPQPVGGWHVYVLMSRLDGKRYVGMSEDVGERLCQHNKGKVKSTSHRRPFVLAYTESFSSRLEARAREIYLKSAAGRRFLDSLGLRLKAGVRGSPPDPARVKP